MPSDKKIAVITGAAQGMGLETARELAKKGYLSIITARSEDKVKTGLKAAGDGDFDGHVLDVADQKSVDRFFDWLGQKYGRIDVLVNNAGIDTGGWENALETSAEKIMESIDNNGLSAWRMIQKALPMMNAAGYGRIVNVSSGMGQLSEMGTGVVPYRLSKTAMNAITRIASNEARGNVKINSVCPGWVRTALGGPRANRSVAEGAAGIVWAATLPDNGPNGGFFRDAKPIDW